MKRSRIFLCLLVAFFPGEFTEAGAQARSSQPGLRGGGPAAPADPATARGLSQDQLAGQREIERYLNLQVRSDPTLRGAWWTNQALMTQLGITDDQKLRIEKVFEAHRQTIVSNRQALEKEEAQLARLLEAESIDRGAVRLQIDSVIRARSEMERTNATMTLEMREQLTRAQWIQFQSTPGLSLGLSAIRVQAPGQRSGPGGQRGGGQRSGAPQ